MVSQPYVGIVSAWYIGQSLPMVSQYVSSRCMSMVCRAESTNGKSICE